MHSQHNNSFSEAKKKKKIRNTTILHVHIIAKCPTFRNIQM